MFLKKLLAKENFAKVLFHFRYKLTYNLTSASLANINIIRTKKKKVSPNL